MEKQKTALSLWGISDELNALNELLILDQGEVSEELEQLQSEAQILLEQKTDSCVGYCEYEKNNIAVAKEKITELRDFIKHKENKIKNFESFVHSCLEKTGKEIFVGEFKQIKLRKASDIVVIDDENKIPMEYTVVETVVKIKKAEIKKALKSGEIAGAHLAKGKQSVMMGLKK